MAFDKKTWANNQGGGTPLDASGLNDLESRITDSIDELDVGIGNRTYTEQNVVTNGESLTKSIDELDVDLASHKAENVATGNPHGIDAKANKTQENWLAPTLLNGWENLAIEFAQTRYYKDEFGIVHIKGFVRSGTDNIFFILPSGYRPTETMYFSTIADNNKACFVSITPDGAVSKPSALTVTAWISLSGISFRAGV